MSDDARPEPGWDEEPSTYERLVMSGRISKGEGRLSELGPPPPAVDDGPTATEILLRNREEERW